ncbi:hypothetical protein [Cellvibrio japonicus]|uniref:Uncharacterized protein n=1 Tax=Cellvibrio japonicus (strain Ueda107) TaxID=498211 RepID=B3PH91_CELJU|nr:hypothetical protein [Cellvibrio japonicus]ACE85175.1 hypothetical protein CJA_0288 [Cellvibrio japonicus Ueda107]
MKVDLFTLVLIVFALGVCVTLVDVGTLFSTAEATVTDETEITSARE